MKGHGAECAALRGKGRGQKIKGVFAIFLCLLSASIFLLSPVCRAAEYTSAEAKIVRFIQEVYDRNDEVRVRLNTMPDLSRENVRVKNVSFSRVPDANGDGICIVEIEASAGRSRSIQVPFRVSVKRKLFILRSALSKDERVRKEDVFVRETFMNGRAEEYPASFDDLAGKVLKRDVTANTILTYQLLVDAVAVKRGEMVDIVAENRNVLVSARGKAVDKGAVGDTIRVKNISSGKQIVGRVVAQNTVSVDF